MIELGLVHGLSAQTLGERYGFHHDAILRHSKNHLTTVQRAALLTASQPTAIDLEELRRTESEGLLGSLVGQRARLQQIVEMAMATGDLRAATSAEGAVTANLTLVSRLLGQLVSISETRHVHLLASPDYIRVRTALVAALRPFPEAAAAVGRALHALEAEATAELTLRPTKPAPTLIEASPVPEPPRPVVAVPLPPPPPPPLYPLPPPPPPPPRGA